MAEIRFATLCFKAWNELASIKHLMRSTHRNLLCSIIKQAHTKQETDVLKSKWEERQCLNSHIETHFCVSWITLALLICLVTYGSPRT